MLKWLKRMLDKLARANDEAFEGQIPDCCGKVKKESPKKAKQAGNNK